MYMTYTVSDLSIWLLLYESLEFVECLQKMTLVLVDPPFVDLSDSRLWRFEGLIPSHPCVTIKKPLPGSSVGRAAGC